jgi:Tfp pilus assembly protein PilV
MTHRLPPLRGFSTLESLIAGTLLLLSVAGVTTAVTTASNVYAHQRHLSHAISIGELALEELLLRYRSAPELAPGSVHQQGYDARGERSASPSATYRVEWRVSSERVANVVRRIDVRVRWQEGVNERHIDLVTYRP